MPEATPKEKALKAVAELPPEATLEDAMERLFFLLKVERGLEDLAAGRVVSHEAVRARFGL
jgi:predicted transcriptional regulator